MSKTTENTDPGEVERLRTHNTELLAELKAAKAKATTLQGQLTTATEERDAARSDLRALRLDAPVRELLERIALPGTTDVLAQMIAARGITFELDGEQIVIRDAAGNPATVIDPAKRNAPASKPRPAKFEAHDLTLLMTEEGLPEAARHTLAQAFPRFIVGTHASGGGSTGGAGANAPAPPVAPTPKPTSAPKAFGLT